MANEPTETKTLPTKKDLVKLVDNHGDIVDVLTSVMLAGYACRIELTTKAVHYCRVVKVTTSGLVVLVDAHPLGTRVTYTPRSAIAAVTIQPDDQENPGIQTEDGQVLYELDAPGLRGS